MKDRWNRETVWVARDDDGNIIRAADEHPDEVLEKLREKLKQKAE